MTEDKPRVGEFYRHFKGKLYQVTALAKHSETGEEMVVYQAMVRPFHTYVRPLSMFVDEVDRDKYPHARQTERFQRVDVTEETEPVLDPMQAEEDLYGASEKAAEESAPSFWLDRVLDAPDINTQLEIVRRMRPYADDRIIDEIAVVLDLTIDEGPTDIRYRQLIQCLETKQRYEKTSRL